MHRAARCCADKTFLCFIGAACVWTALYTVVESASSCVDYQLFASHASWYCFGDEVLNRQRLRSHGKYNDRIFVIMPHLNAQREMRPIVTHVAWSLSLIGSYTLPITSVQSLVYKFFTMWQCMQQVQAVADGPALPLSMSAEIHQLLYNNFWAVKPKVSSKKSY